MSQLSLSLDSSLLVRDAQGRYLLASADQILAAIESVRETARRQDASSGDLRRGLEQLNGSIQRVRVSATRLRT